MAETKIPMKIQDNSNKAREKASSESLVKPIAKGKMRNRSLAMKFADVFFEGSLKDAIDYIINDVAIPQVKNAALRGLEVIFYGGVNGSSSSRSSSGSSNTPYNSYFVGRDGVRRTNTTAGPSRRVNEEEMNRIKKKYDPRLITLEDRGMAARVLEELKRDCDEFGQISVQRLFELVDVDSDWTSTKYGWVRGDLDNARVRPCADGWCFELPDPYPID